MAAGPSRDVERSMDVERDPEIEADRRLGNSLLVDVDRNGGQVAMYGDSDLMPFKTILGP